MANRNSYFGHMIWPDDGLEKNVWQSEGKYKKEKTMEKVSVRVRIKEITGHPFKQKLVTAKNRWNVDHLSTEPSKSWTKLNGTNLTNLSK